MAQDKLAIFIDGSNLYNMAREMGIAYIDYQRLFEILVHEIGSDMPLIGPPAISLSHYAVSRFGHILERAGYCMIPFDPGSDDEDQLIIAQIEACDPQEIAGIIVVTGDGDFHNILSTKKAEGIEILVVAANIYGFKGERRVSRSLIESQFTFHDLATYRDRLIYRPFPVTQLPPLPTLAKPNGTTQKGRRIRIKIEVPADIPAEQWQALMDRTKNIINLPGIRSRVTIDVE